MAGSVEAGVQMRDQRGYVRDKVAGVSIEGVPINLPTLAATLAETIRRALRGQGFTLFTLNLDHLVKLRANAAFRSAYQRADLVTADGWPVVWLAARDGARLERTCGSDLVEPLCAAAAAHDLAVYFIGPGATAQAEALDILRQRHPALFV